MKKIILLSINDIKNILREPIISIVFIIPIIMAILVRFGIPVLTLKISNFLNLIEYYPIISAYMLLVTPVFVGIVTAFLMLDEKDDNILVLLFTTPLSKNGYIIYRVLIPVVVSFLYSLIIIRITGLIKVPFMSLIPLSVMVALEASIVALFLFIFAGNKVEGLTLSKGLNLLLLAPLVEYFVESKYTVLIGVIPFYWPIKGFISILDSTYYWIYILVGLLIHFFYLIAFIKVFKRKSN